MWCIKSHSTDISHKEIPSYQAIIHMVTYIIAYDSSNRYRPPTTSILVSILVLSNIRASTYFKLSLKCGCRKGIITILYDKKNIRLLFLNHALHVKT